MNQIVYVLFHICVLQCCSHQKMCRQGQDPIHAPMVAKVQVPNQPEFNGIVSQWLLLPIPKLHSNVPRCTDLTSFHQMLILQYFVYSTSRRSLIVELPPLSRAEKHCSPKAHSTIAMAEPTITRWAILGNIVTSFSTSKFRPHKTDI